MLEGRSAGEYMEDHTSCVRREPIGVVGQVTPWNYPLMMMIWKIAPALAAGNTIVLKPSRHHARPPRRCSPSWPRSSCRPACSTSSAATATPAGRWSSTRPRRWCRSPARCAPAWRSPASAAADLKRVHLELGGKAPVIVFDDADIEAAAEGIAGAGYFNAGQDCTAATRVLAGPGVHDDFVAALTEQAAGHARPACPTTRTCSTARSTTPNQLDRVTGMVDRLPDHASVETGGTRQGDARLLLRADRLSGLQPGRRA